MTGFGLAYLCTEGGAMHPDDRHIDDQYEWTDEAFLSQLRAYRVHAGDSVFHSYCSRPELLKQLKEEA